MLQRIESVISRSLRFVPVLCLVTICQGLPVAQNTKPASDPGLPSVAHSPSGVGVSPSAGQDASATVVRNLEKKIDVELRNVALREALRFISAVGGVNIAAPPGIVDTKVELHFQQATVKDVLKHLLAGVKLTYEVDGNVIRVKRKPGPELAATVFWMPQKSWHEVLRAVNRSELIGQPVEHSSSVLVRDFPQGVFDDLKFDVLAHELNTGMDERVKLTASRPDGPAANLNVHWTAAANGDVMVRLNVSVDNDREVQTAAMLRDAGNTAFIPMAQSDGSFIVFSASVAKPAPLPPAPIPRPTTVPSIRTKAMITSQSQKAWSRLRTALRISSDSHASTWNLTRSQASVFHAFCREQKNDVTVLSVPQIRSVIGQEATIQVGSELAVDGSGRRILGEIPVLADAGGNTTAVGFVPVGLKLGLTVNALASPGLSVHWDITNAVQTSQDPAEPVVVTRRSAEGTSRLKPLESLLVAIPAVDEGEQTWLVTLLEPGTQQYRTAVGLYELRESDRDHLIQIHPAIMNQPSILSAAPGGAIQQAIEKLMVRGSVRCLSRPSLITMDGVPASVTTAGIRPDADDQPTASRALLNVTVSEASQSTDGRRHELLWKLVDGRGEKQVPSAVFSEGRVLLNDGQPVVSVSPCQSPDGEQRYLLLMIESKAINVPDTETMPAATYLTDDVQYYPPGPEFHLRGRSTPSTTPAPEVPEILQDRTLPVTAATKIVHGHVSETWTLVFPSRVTRVSGFDPSTVTVSPVSSDPLRLQIRMKRVAATSLKLAFENGSQRLLQVRVKTDDAGLTDCLRRIFPQLDIETHVLNQSVLLRGTVLNKLQERHVTAVAEQIFPTVLSQLRYGQLPARKSFSASAAAAQVSVRLKEEGVTAFIQPGVTCEVKCPERILSASNTDGLEIGFGDQNQLHVTCRDYVARTICVTSEKATYSLRLVPQADVSEVRSVIQRLYPNARVRLFPVQASLVLTGSVSNREHLDQVVQICEQYFPQVVQCLETVPVPSVSAVRDPRSNRPQTVRAASHSTDGRLREIRNDVRELREEVRALIEFLRTQPTTPAKDASDPTTSVDSHRMSDGKQPVGLAGVNVQTDAIRSGRGLGVTVLSDAGLPGTVIQDPPVARRILFFEADYCVPCREMSDRIALLQQDAEKAGVDLSRVDITRNTGLVREYQIDRIPTLIQLDNGQETMRQSGVLREETLRRFLSFEDTAGASP